MRQERNGGRHHTENGAVKVAILSVDGRVILIKNPERPSPLWVLPGGTIEDGETVREAAIREVKDEAGLTIRDSDLRMVHDQQQGRPYRPYRYFAMLSNEEFDKRDKIGDENGALLLVEAFALSEAATMHGVHPMYQEFLAELSGALASTIQAA